MNVCRALTLLLALLVAVATLAQAFHDYYDDYSYKSKAHKHYKHDKGHKGYKGYKAHKGHKGHKDHKGHHKNKGPIFVPQPFQVPIVRNVPFVKHIHVPRPYPVFKDVPVPFRVIKQDPHRHQDTHQQQPHRPHHQRHHPHHHQLHHDSLRKFLSTHSYSTPQFYNPPKYNFNAASYAEPRQETLVIPLSDPSPQAAPTNGILSNTTSTIFRVYQVSAEDTTSHFRSNVTVQPTSGSERIPSIPPASATVVDTAIVPNCEGGFCYHNGANYSYVTEMSATGTASRQPHMFLSALAFIILCSLFIVAEAGFLKGLSKGMKKKYKEEAKHHHPIFIPKPVHVPIINHIPIVKHVPVPKPFTIYRPVPVPVYEEPKKLVNRPRKGNFIYIPKGYAPFPNSKGGAHKPDYATVPGSIIEIPDGYTVVPNEGHERQEDDYESVLEYSMPNPYEDYGNFLNRRSMDEDRNPMFPINFDMSHAMSSIQGTRMMPSSYEDNYPSSPYDFSPNDNDYPGGFDSSRMISSMDNMGPSFSDSGSSAGFGSSFSLSPSDEYRFGNSFSSPFTSYLNENRISSGGSSNGISSLDSYGVSGFYPGLNGLFSSQGSLQNGMGQFSNAGGIHQGSDGMLAQSGGTYSDLHQHLMQSGFGDVTAGSGGTVYNSNGMYPGLSTNGGSDMFSVNRLGSGSSNSFRLNSGRSFGDNPLLMRHKLQQKRVNNMKHFRNGQIGRKARKRRDKFSRRVGVIPKTSLSPESDLMTTSESFAISDIMTAPDAFTASSSRFVPSTNNSPTSISAHSDHQQSLMSNYFHSGHMPASSHYPFNVVHVEAEGSHRGLVGNPYWNDQRLYAFANYEPFLENITEETQPEKLENELVEINEVE